MLLKFNLLFLFIFLSVLGTAHSSFAQITEDSSWSDEPVSLDTMGVDIHAYQEDTSINESSYTNEKMELRKLDEDKWRDLKKELNYTTTQKKKAEKPPKPHYDKPSPGFNLWGGIPSIVFYIIVIAALVFILAKLLGINFIPNKKVDYDSTISIDTLEEKIHVSDLDRYLREAMNNKNYKLAIRIYYLIILKELSIKNWIEWKKDKTNREYLYEMSQKENYQSFSELTLTFEKIWYGDWEIKEEDYQILSPKFKNFIEGIRK